MSSQNPCLNVDESRWLIGLRIAPFYVMKGVQVFQIAPFQTPAYWNPYIPIYTWVVFHPLYITPTNLVQTITDLTKSFQVYLPNIPRCLGGPACLQGGPLPVMSRVK